MVDIMGILAGISAEKSLESLKKEIDRQLQAGIKGSNTTLETYPDMKPDELVRTLLAYGEAV